MQALELFENFAAPIEQAGFPYFVTGSVASIVYGEPRLTHDIDIVLNLTDADVEKLLLLFPEERYYCPPAEVIHAELRRRPFAHFNLIHHESGLKADIYPDTGDPLHAWALKRRRRIQLSSQLGIWLAPPEYVIIRKLEYYREGGSEKHLDDIRNMLAVSGAGLDIEFMEQETGRRQLKELWHGVRRS